MLFKKLHRLALSNTIRDGKEIEVIIEPLIFNYISIVRECRAISIKNLISQDILLYGRERVLEYGNYLSTLTQIYYTVERVID